jgi:ATP-dependent Clp protease ATP-binding subunit ClpX
LQIPDVGEGKEKIIAVLVDEESVGPVSRQGCGAKIFRDDGALELYIYQNNIRVPGLIHGPERNVIFSFCLIVVLSAAKLMGLSYVSLFLLGICMDCIDTM